MVMLCLVLLLIVDNDNNNDNGNDNNNDIDNKSPFREMSMTTIYNGRNEYFPCFWLHWFIGHAHAVYILITLKNHIVPYCS